MSAVPSNGADLGLVGPNSVTWQLHANPAMWLAGIASLFLQSLHPSRPRAWCRTRTSACPSRGAWPTPRSANAKSSRRCSIKKLTEQMALRLLRPDRKDETYRNGNLGGVRQWIESVNQTRKGQLGLEQHGGRTPAGGFTRVAQRLLAMAAGIWHNWTTGATSKRSLIAFDQ